MVYVKYIELKPAFEFKKCKIMAINKHNIINKWKHECNSLDLFRYYEINEKFWEIYWSR